MSVVADGCGVNIKEGVELDELHPTMITFLSEASCMIPLMITSTTEGVHSKNSKHYLGLAVDIRTWGLKKSQLEELVRIMKEQLPDYTYIIEDTHLHVHANGNWM